MQVVRREPVYKRQWESQERHPHTALEDLSEVFGRFRTNVCVLWFGMGPPIGSRVEEGRPPSMGAPCQSRSSVFVVDQHREASQPVGLCPDLASVLRHIRAPDPLLARRGRLVGHQVIPEQR